MGRNKKQKEKQEARLKKGVKVTSQTKLVVENVRKYFESQKLKGHGYGGVNVMKRTAEATGLSMTTIKRVHNEYLTQDGKFFSPVKRYKVSRIRTVEDITIDTIEDSEDKDRHDNDNKEDVTDKDNRQLIDRRIEQEQSTSTGQPSTSSTRTDVRTELTPEAQHQHEEHLLNVLPIA